VSLYFHYMFQITKTLFKETSDDDDSSDSDSSDDAAEEDADDSDDSSSDEADAAPSKKRKADDEPEVSAKKAKAEVEDTGSKNLFVGNLSWNIDDEWLYREFEEFGEITGARVISDRDSGRSKGFGYVEFANSEDAAKALKAKKGALIDGREANVDFSTPRDNTAPKERANQRAATYGDAKNPESDTLFVGNISFEANEDMLGEAFGAHGTVVNVRLPTDM
jgi:nucleolin